MKRIAKRVGEHALVGFLGWVGLIAVFEVMHYGSRYLQARHEDRKDRKRAAASSR
jgi:hypothetical protein